MNLIDLRQFNYELDKIVSFDNNKFILGDTVFEEGTYKRYFYMYDLQSKSIHKINHKGIESCENAFYNTYVADNYIYTNAYKVDGNEVTTSIYRIHLFNGNAEKLYSAPRDMSVIILNHHYVLFRGSEYGIDKEHLDQEKDIMGEYDYAILCDLNEGQEYPIRDKRIVLGIRDYFISYKVDNKTYIVFEEAYMEDWELEEAFEEGIKKEEFYREGYRESINIISMDKFAQSIKKGLTIIPFTQVYKTEFSAWARYFGMDFENIYFRVKNFETKIEDIYKVNKHTLQIGLLKSIKIEAKKVDYYSYDTWYDTENRKIYEIQSVDGKNKIIREIFDRDFIFEVDAFREDYIGTIGEYIITGFWTEDEDGENYKEFVRIRHMKSNSIDTYQGNCSIINDNVILFR